jgi:hypothetical protein
MNVNLLNERLLTSTEAPASWFPRMETLSRPDVTFDLEFGLPTLPTAPGLLPIPGPSQYGKSSWLEQQLRKANRSGGPGSTFYLNGDPIADAEQLAHELLALAAMFRPDAPHRQLSIVDCRSRSV